MPRAAARDMRTPGGTPPQHHGSVPRLAAHCLCGSGPVVLIRVRDATLYLPSCGSATALPHLHPHAIQLNAAVCVVQGLRKSLGIAAGEARTGCRTNASNAPPASQWEAVRMNDWKRTPSPPDSARWPGQRRGGCVVAQRSASGVLACAPLCTWQPPQQNPRVQMPHYQAPAIPPPPTPVSAWRSARAAQQARCAGCAL